MQGVETIQNTDMQGLMEFGTELAMTWGRKIVGAMKDLGGITGAFLKVAGNVEKARGDYRLGASLKYLYWSNFVQKGVFQRHPELLSVVTLRVADTERL